MQLDIIAKSIAENSKDIIRSAIKARLTEMANSFINEVANDMADKLEGHIQHMMVRNAGLSEKEFDVNIVLSIDRQQVPRRPKSE
jgi:hypothetical protein